VRGRSRVEKRNPVGWGRFSRRELVVGGARNVARLAAAAAPFALSACRRAGDVVAPAPLPSPQPPAGFGPATLVGAHYYLWFPELFAGGRYLRAHLAPAQRPVLGEYASTSAAVVEQHIAWAAGHGIDFFTLDWWPGLPERNASIDIAFLAARNVGDIRFCIFYELWGLGYDGSNGTTPFAADTVERFLADMDAITERYFRHPRYLRIGGRPVIVLYLTRPATGRFAEAIERFRERAAAVGVDPCVIGDEVFWEVARETGGGYTPEPERGRIALFDALTAYNLYDQARPQHAGYAARSPLLDDASALFERYRAASDRPLVPLAMPGYNDRALRPEAGHDAIPRAWDPRDAEGSFFGEWLRRFSLPWVDARLPMLLITSWNEWNEDTAIEPLSPAASTRLDDSLTGDAYTQGFAYSGYGMLYLEILRAVTGRR